MNFPAWAQWLERWKDTGGVILVAIAAATALIAVATFVKGVLEYRGQGKQKRLERFLEVRKRFKESGPFMEIFGLLEQDPGSLLKDQYTLRKTELLGFFEEVAVLMYNGVFSRSMTHYMFGYYALKCWDSEEFWSSEDRHSSYWVVFRKFCDDMKAEERALKERIESGSSDPVKMGF
jgi:hypothetical protein